MSMPTFRPLALGKTAGWEQRLGRRSVLACMAGAVACAFLVLPSCNKKNAKHDEPGPRMTLESGVLDLGKVSSATPQPWTIRFRNTGTEDLVIAQTISDCSCASVATPIRRISPGGEGRIVGELVTNQHRGPQNAKIVIKTNEKGHELTLISIRANVVDDIAASPGELYVGDIQGVWTGRAWVRLKEPYWAVTDVSSRDPGVACRIIGERMISDRNGKEVEIEVSVNSMERTPGPIAGTMLIRTNTKLAPQIKVPIIGYAWGRIRCIPATITFGPTKAGEVRTAKVLIQTYGNEALAVKGAGGVIRSAVVARRERDGEYDVLIEWSAEGMEHKGVVRECLTVSFVNEPTCRVEIPIVAFVE